MSKKLPVLSGKKLISFLGGLNYKVYGSVVAMLDLKD